MHQRYLSINRALSRRNILGPASWVGSHQAESARGTADEPRGLSQRRKGVMPVLDPPGYTRARRTEPKRNGEMSGTTATVTSFHGRQRWRPWHRACTTLAVAGSLLAIAACGGSTKPSSLTGSSSYRQAVAFADCMRSHGVSNFPDPGAGARSAIQSTINAQSPAYRSATRACAKLQPSPSVPHNLSERSELHLVAAAKCMRQHGVSMADPKFRGPYITLDVPDQTTMRSPAFQHAEKGCHYPLPNPAGSGAASP